MPEVTVTSLDPRHQKLIENARVALDRGNLEYTLEVTAQVLKVAPGCLPVRRLRRVAQLKDAKGKGSFMSRTLGGFSTAPFMFGGGKKDPAKLLESAEALLAKDPTSVAALKLMVLVWPVCMRLPLTSSHMASFCTLGTSSRVTSQGPIGPKVSQPLPLSHCGPRSSWNSRSLTSLMVQKPAT